jgi:hypothetical protein
MGSENMKFLVYWIPTFVGAFLIAAAGVVLIILETRSQRRRRSEQSK